MVVAGSRAVPKWILPGGGDGGPRRPNGSCAAARTRRAGWIPPTSMSLRPGFQTDRTERGATASLRPQHWWVAEWICIVRSEWSILFRSFRISFPDDRANSPPSSPRLRQAGHRLFSSSLARFPGVFGRIETHKESPSLRLASLERPERESELVPGCGGRRRMGIPCEGRASVSESFTANQGAVPCR